MQKIEFRDTNGINYIVNVPILNQEKPMLLRMWVAYDRGRRYSQYDYSEVKRGFYLYFSLEEVSDGYPARTLLIDRDNWRLYLGEVKRKSEGWYKDFSELAGEIALSAINEKFPNFSFDWSKMSFSYWSGKGSGVGLYCDFYQIFLPQKEWLFAS